MKFFLSLCLIAMSLLLSACTTESDAAHTVYLVRHAEKVDNSRDPALSPEGVARADALADRLADAGITRIFSSDYERTRETARPLSQRLGLAVTLYDPRDLSALSESLKAEPGTYLVVGHSNTTPQLAALLGGESGPPIVEATEYDRLYVLTQDDDGSVETDIQRYGATD